MNLTGNLVISTTVFLLKIENIVMANITITVLSLQQLTVQSTEVQKKRNSN